MRCIECDAAEVSERPERTARGYRLFRCRVCRKQFNERSGGILNRAQYPSDVIALVVFWRLRHKLLVAGFSDRSNSAVRRRNGGLPCRIWAPTVRRDKINRWNCLERNFVGVRVGCSQSAMSVLTQNVFGTIQAITEKVSHFSASRPNSRGQRNPQPVVGYVQLSRRAGEAALVRDGE